MSRTFKEKLLESGIGDYAAELINDPGSHGSNIVTAKVNNLTGGIGKIINTSTFAEASQVNEKALVFVQTDETNDSQMTAYFHNGQKLNWLPSVEV